MTAVALRIVRRSGARSGSRRDRLFALYAGLMAGAVIGLPLLHLLVEALSAAPALMVLTSPSSPLFVHLGCGALLATAVACGRLRGPALRQPFLVVTLAGSGAPRHRTLAGPFVTATAGLTALLTIGAFLTGGVLVSQGLAGPGTVAAAVAGAVAIGVIASTSWLLGQVLSNRSATTTVIALFAATALTAFFSSWSVLTPWGAAAALHPVFPADARALAMLLVIGAGALACSPLLLDRLRGPDLLSQAQRWQTAGMIAGTGDLAAAFAPYRARPAVGRRWTVLHGRHPVITVPVRDALGALRTPARTVLAGAGFLAAGLLVALAALLPTPLQWMPALAGGLVGFAALGVVSDGVRFALETIAAPPLYGQGPLELLVLHGILPVACAVVLGGAGAMIAVALGAGPGAVVTAVACLLVLMLVRVADCAKGPLPLALTISAPTVFGDMSAVVLVAWQVDALLWAGGTAALATLGLVPLLPVLALVLVLTHRRVRALHP